MILILIIKIFWCHVPPLDFDASSVLTFFCCLCLFFFRSTLSQCCHAVVALLYPFTWQHTYIPVLPPSMLDIVCTPTPFIVGLLSSSLPRLKELPIEEVRYVCDHVCGASHWSIAPGNYISVPRCLFSTGLGRGPRQQSLSAAGNEHAQQILLRVVILKGRAVFWLLWHLCLSPFTAGWRGLHSATQAAGSSGACAGQEERAGLW